MQVLTHADTCHYMSLIDQHKKMHAMELQLQVAAMIAQGAAGSHLCSHPTSLYTSLLVCLPLLLLGSSLFLQGSLGSALVKSKSCAVAQVQ